MKKEKPGAPNIILDISIKRALEAKASVTDSYKIVLPWWFKRDCGPKRSHESNKAFAWLMNWLNENAPESTENVYCELDDSQNIVISPLIILAREIQEAFVEAGFRLITEDELPDSEKTDVWERIKAGSNFSDEWH